MSPIDQHIYLDLNLNRELCQGSGILPELAFCNAIHFTEGYLGEVFVLPNVKEPDPNRKKGDSQKSDRRNDGRLRDPVLKYYYELDRANGIIYRNIDPLTGEYNGYMRAKLEKPRKDAGGKIIKYEAPRHRSFEPFFFKVVPTIWKQISEKSGVPLPDDYGDGKKGRPQIPKEEITARFWQWVKDNPKVKIWITEGEKKALCLLSNGYVAVSIPGINCWHNVELKKSEGVVKLHPMLETFAKDREFVICFDQDEKQKSRQNVYKAIASLSKCIKSYSGCSTLIASWNSRYGKGIDDYVVNGNSLDNIRLATPRSYLGRDINDKLKAIADDIYLQIDREFLGDIPFPDKKVIGLGAPKGSGKTELISIWIDELMSKGYRVLVPLHRTQLTIELAARYGLTAYSEMIDSSELSTIGRHFGYCLCFDSLRLPARIPFKVNQWLDDDRPYVIILDEIEQSLWHLFAANTDIKKDRVEVIENFELLCANAKHIICSDTDLSSVSLDYICAVSHCGKDDLAIIQNTYQGNGYHCYSYPEGKPTRLLLDLVNRIEYNHRHNIKKTQLLMVSAQRAKNTYSSINLEDALSTKQLEAHFKKIFPQLKILRIDAESIIEPGHPSYHCIEHLNEIIPQYDIVIATNVIETGISINKDLPIDTVWGIFQGVATTDAVRQALMRYRGYCDRRVWIAEYGLSSIGDGSPFPRELRRSQDNHFKFLVNQLNQVSNNGLDDLENVSNPALDCFYKMAARINYGMLNYREQILRDLEAEGNTISILDLPNEDEIIQCSELLQFLRGIRDKNYDLFNQETVEAPSLSDRELKQIESKKERTKGDRLKLRKGITERKYAKVNITKDLLIGDDKGLFPKLKLLYYLTIGEDFLGQFEMENINSKKRGNKTFTPDVLNGSKMLKIRALQQPKIKALLQECNSLLDAEFTKDSPLLMEIVSKALKIRGLLLEYLGIRISEDMHSIQIINKLLRLINRKLPYLRQERQKGVRVRVYGYPVQLIPIGDLEQEILDGWLKSDLESLAKALDKEAA